MQSFKMVFGLGRWNYEEIFT